MKKYLLFFLLVMMGNVWGQTNPTAHNLSTSNFSFTGFAAGTTTTYPTSMQGWKFSAEPTSATVGDASGDRVLAVSTDGITSGSIRNEVANGISLLNSSSNNIGAIVVAINTTNRKNIKISWVAAQLYQGASRISGLKLQYRIGTLGDFSNIENTDYQTSLADPMANAMSFTNILLPVTCENQSNIQLRWIYYNVSGSGGRDRIRLDEISITSESAASLSTEPSAYPASFTATTVSQTQIDLAFSAASTITNAAGYVIMQKVGSALTGVPLDATGYSVGNTIGDATVAAIITNTSSTSVSITGLTAGTQYYYAIIPYNWDGSSAATYNYKTDGTLTTANATTEAPLDGDSKVDGPVLGSQPDPVGISSLADTDIEAIRVFDMDVYDYGTADGQPTKITQITIKPGTNNTAFWPTTIGGVKLSTDPGNTFVTIGTTTITDESIVIPITSGNLDIVDGDAATVSLYVYLKNTGLTDNQILEFKVDGSAHGFTADATGSTFASTFSDAPVSNQILIDVEATELKFTANKPPATVNENTNFEVEVEAVDANGNRDLDATNSVTLSKNTGPGNLSSVSGTSKSLITGLISWNDVQLDTEGDYTIDASATGLTAATSSTISVTGLVSGAVDLFISEYVEGSGNEKYIEIFNGTGSVVDLSLYNVKTYGNGATSSTYSYTFNAGESLQNNSVVVIKNPSATLYDSPISSDITFFNGDDAVALYKGSVLIDLIGRIGEDPGAAWGTSPLITLDKTLVRKATVVEGVSENPESGFPTLATEWDSYNQNTVSYLGSHTFSPQPAGSSTQTVSGDGIVTFANTSVRINFTGVSNSKDVTVKKFNSRPANITGISETNISKFRWVINGNGLGFTSGVIRFKRNELPGVNYPISGTIKLYKRSTPGSGAFELVGDLSYDAVNDELNQTVTSFSEFVMASNNNPLPVEITSFTAKYLSSGVVLNWQTATEINNNKFEVERQINEGNWEVVGEVLGHGNSNTVIDYTYTDSKTSTKGKYNYRLKQIDNDGTFKYTQVVNVTVGNLDNYELAQNYPNPFNPSTNINFTMPKAGNVKIVLFNALGQEVATLFNGNKDAGFHTVQFNANGLPSGIYFYQMTSEGFNQVKKMILTK